MGEISAVIVSSPDMAMQIMKTHDLRFVDRPQLLTAKVLVYGTADIIFAPYGDYWRQMRKICTLELLSAKMVQSFSYIREHEVAQLIESIQSCVGSSINLTSKIFSLTSDIVARAAFGNKRKDQDEFLCSLKEAVELSGGFDLADLFPSLKPLHLITRMKARLEKMHKRLDRRPTMVPMEDKEEITHNMFFFLNQLNHFDPFKHVFCTSVGPNSGEFIPGEPRLTDFNTPDLPPIRHYQRFGPGIRNCNAPGPSRRSKTRLDSNSSPRSKRSPKRKSPLKAA
ncbi:Cytochrome P450 71D8 [Senna tora]|uniref:Cytochrome P450 71D8 n=1 Tax=Senna tora TaxID=362788 RepID=A0A834W9G4_9FABA|nr:Cytochrome P450 71D8 [Senna tora]